MNLVQANLGCLRRHGCWYILIDWLIIALFATKLCVWVCLFAHIFVVWACYFFITPITQSHQIFLLTYLSSSLHRKIAWPNLHHLYVQHVQTGVYFFPIDKLTAFSFISFYLSYLNNVSSAYLQHFCPCSTFVDCIHHLLLFSWLMTIKAEYKFSPLLFIFCFLHGIIYT